MSFEKTPLILKPEDADFAIIVDAVAADKPIEIVEGAKSPIESGTDPLLHKIPDHVITPEQSNMIPVWNHVQEHNVQNTPPPSTM